MEKKFFWVVDDNTTARGLFDAKKLDTQDKGQALWEAEKEWTCLTRKEQKERDAFYLAYGPEDEIGDVDLNEADVIKEFK